MYIKRNVLVCFMSYKFIDLFCGIGGFRVALEKCGLECVFSSDIDPFAREAYKENFGDLPSGDITIIHEKKFPSMMFYVQASPASPLAYLASKMAY